MLKNILKLKGAQKLTNNEQKSINGGITIAMMDCLASGCVMAAASPGAGWVAGCGGSKNIWCDLN